MAKLLPHQIAVVAALLGRSNMGQDIRQFGAPNGERCETTRRALSNTSADLGSAVETFCGDICETDEHFDMFIDEAKYFAKEIRKNEAEARKSWPGAFQIAGV